MIFRSINLSNHCRSLEDTSGASANNKGYMKKITIKWGTDKDKTKTYTFKNDEELKFFMMGVDEANGWLEYEIKE